MIISSSRRNDLSCSLPRPLHCAPDQEFLFSLPLKKRYARGEITKEKYEKKKRDIGLYRATFPSHQQDVAVLADETAFSILDWNGKAFSLIFEPHPPSLLVYIELVHQRSVFCGYIRFEVLVLIDDPTALEVRVAHSVHVLFD